MKILYIFMCIFYLSMGTQFFRRIVTFFLELTIISEKNIG